MWGEQTHRGAGGPFKKVLGEQRTGLHSRSRKVKEGLLPGGGVGGEEKRNGEQNKIDGREEGREGEMMMIIICLHTQRFFSLRISFRRNQRKTKQKP